jgi:ABC-type branched-subunit amino acid transport system substrate-binding protein
MYLNARRGLAIAASAALLAVSGACTSGTGGSSSPSSAPQDPGVTANSILLATAQPLTGPASPGYSKISPATKAYFDYINKHGGVNGRMITYKINDDMYNPTTTNTVVRQAVEQDKIFAWVNGLGTPTESGILPYLKAQKVPDLFVASGSLSWNQPSKYPNTFAVNLDYTSEGKILATYVKQNFASAKVCYFGQGDDFGADELAGVEKVLGPLPANQKTTYDVTQQNVGPQMAQMKAAGCTLLMAASIPGFTALAIGTSAAINWHPQVVESGVGADYTTLAGYLKTAAPMLNGLISIGYLPAVMDTANSWNQLFMNINKDFNGNAAYDGNVQYGMAIGWLTVEALKKAGPNLTRQGLIDAIESGGYTNGPGLVPLLYSKTSHAGYAGGQISKITGTNQAYIGTPFVTDSGDGAVTAYTTPEATAPAYLGAS